MKSEKKTMDHFKSRNVVVTLICMNTVIPFIIAKTGTYYYVKQDLRTVASNNITISVGSKLECAESCMSDDTCVIANHGKSYGNSLVCELMSVESEVSDLSVETSGDWQTIGKLLSLHKTS